MVTEHATAPAASAASEPDQNSRVCYFKGGYVALGEARILVLPDHYTPVALRTHVGNPVPFVLCGAGVEADRADRLDEAIAAESPLFVEEGWRLIGMLLGK